MKEIIKICFNKWKTNYNFKTLISSAGAFLITTAFALYNGFLGLRYGSVWNGCICVYYILLSVTRGIIPFVEKKNLALSENAAKNRRILTFRVTSIIILVTDIALIVPIALMVLNDRYVNMGLIPSIAMATYTTFKIVTAIMNIKKARKSDNILVREIRTINFIDACVSVLTLQNTLIIVNQGENSGDMFLLSAISSAAIFLIIITVSVWSIVTGVRACSH